jgi:hypothetical protein
VDLLVNKFGHPNIGVINTLFPNTKIDIKDIEKDKYFRFYRTDDFKHNGSYNDLDSLRKTPDGTTNEIISYIFGIVPKDNEISLINVYRIYHQDEARETGEFYAWKSTNEKQNSFDHKSVGGKKT